MNKQYDWINNLEHLEIHTIILSSPFSFDIILAVVAFQQNHIIQYDISNNDKSLIPGRCGSH